MQSLEHIIYASVATQDFGAPQLAELLQKSRAANGRFGLTGMLLHSDSDGSFFQVLEGEPCAIDRLLQKLNLDKRHSHLTIIIREPIVERAFAGWTMGFASVSPEKLRKIPGLNDFFKEGTCFTELDSGRAKKLLEAFARGRWRPKHLGVKVSGFASSGTAPGETFKVFDPRDFSSPVEMKSSVVPYMSRSRAERP